MSLPNLLLTAVAIASISGSAAANAESGPVRNVVLVHGAFADGSGWKPVADLLRADGFEVSIVQQPMTSVADDVAATIRILDMQSGPAVLVGHSYGGAVITEAGNSDKVKALVYVAAFAPAVGQSINAIVGAAPEPPPWQGELHADATGWLTWSAAGMAQYFAPDLSPEQAAVLAAVQSPLFSGAFDGQVTKTAYSDKPSWYVIADNDQVIPPALQQMFADSIGATAVHVASSHVAMLSQPQVVADAIIAAVEGVR